MCVKNIGNMYVIFASILLFLILIYLISYIMSQSFYLNHTSKLCLMGKNAVVTGGSSGLGYQIVLGLASRGCKVIIADIIINNDIRKAIIKETNNYNIILEYVDFASFDSVRKFAEKLKKTEAKLDILVNNVGIGKSNTLSKDGLNTTMEVNYFTSFLLTHLLVDLLKMSDGGRIIFTSSLLSFFHLITLNLVTEARIKDRQAELFRNVDYANSKFCIVVASKLFAKKLKKFNITCNAYHPGIIRTAIFDQTRNNLKNLIEFLIYYIILYPIGIIFGISVQKASQTAVELAISKEFKTLTGTFFGFYFPNLLPRAARDAKLCNKIWTASENTVQLKLEERLD